MPPEEDSSEGREGEDEGMRAALRGLIGGLLAAFVADVGAAVVGGVGVHDFAVETGIGDSEAVAFADHRSGVDDGHDEVSRILAAANKTKNAVVGIVGVNPFETVPVEFHLMKRRLGSIEMIEIRDELLDAAVGLVLKQMPVETTGFAPFVALGEFLAHEQELFARVGILIGVEKAKISELLPHIARHFVEERIFAVNDFVV